VTARGLLCAALLWSCATLARAEPGDYASLVNRAVVEFRAGAWEEARALFRAAHQLEPSARTLRGLALTAFELHRYVDCIVELEAALAHPVRPLEAAQRAEAEGLLARAREFVARFTVTTDPEGAELLVDGAPTVQRDGALLLDSGPHTLTVQAPGFQTREQQLRVAAGEARTLRVVLQPVQEARPDAASDGTPVSPGAGPRAPERRSAHPRYTIALGSAGAAAVLAGGGLWFAAYAQSKDVQACDADHDDCAAEAARGRRLESSAYVALGVGAALGGAALAVWLLEGRDKSGSTELAIAPTRLVLRARF
jgi:hypothetical protein